MIGEESAQVSMEMLFLVAGAVVIATIVGFYLKTIAREQIAPAAANELNAVINAFG